MDGELKKVAVFEIFTNDNNTDIGNSEGYLLGYLRRLGLRKGNINPIFGSIEDVLADFTKRAYLDRIRVQTADADTFEYKWGPRAKIELPEENLIQFMAEVRN